jgi:hypothetical protein
MARVKKIRKNYCHTQARTPQEKHEMRTGQVLVRTCPVLLVVAFVKK